MYSQCPSWFFVLPIEILSNSSTHYLMMDDVVTDWCETEKQRNAINCRFVSN